MWTSAFRLESASGVGPEATRLAAAGLEADPGWSTIVSSAAVVEE